MTKRELLRWLEFKRESVLQEMRENYNKALDALWDKEIERINLAGVASKMESHLDAALKLWRDWKDTHKNDKSVSFLKPNSYNALECALYEYTFSEGNTFKTLESKEVEICTPEMERLKTEFKETIGKVKETYDNVFMVISSMPNSKTISEYLVSLGFDLSELVKSPEPVTALTVQIDPAYLLLKKAA